MLEYRHLQPCPGGDGGGARFQGLRRRFVPGVMEGVPASRDYEGGLCICAGVSLDCVTVDKDTTLLPL